MIKLLLCCFAFGTLLSAAAETPGIQGDWLGTLSFNGVNLRLAFL
jgi:hypothetical protein